MAEFIDLGTKMGGEKAEPTKAPEAYYPSLHIRGPKDMALPAEGEAIIKFRKGDSGTRKRDGKTEYYCDIEVLGIKPSGSKMSEPKKGPAFGESLDRAIATREEASEDED